VSPLQINFQMPANQAPGQDAAEVRINGQRVARGVVTTLARSPGLFIALDQQGRVGRVRRGDYLTIYGSGPGAVSPALAEGIAPPLDPLSTTTAAPTIRLGNRELQPSFTGMVPGYPGLWQINVQVPADAAPGATDVSVLFDASLPSNVLSIAIE
jgi:uncharacterized protein (TIGR03437 family)